MTGPCAKQVVVATVVHPDGRTYQATNHCNKPQQTCPRRDLPTGQGYHLCREICDQPAHAEVNVLALAGDAARGATLYLRGHTYACENCIAAAHAAGIARLVIGPPP